MFAPLTAGMNVADMAWEVKCREEDMKQRALENERRAIDDARRSVDEKAQQLKAISHLSALIAGFAMVVIVEVQIDPSLSPVLLTIFGLTVSIVVGTMLIAMLNCTLMLVAILRYNTVLREVPFGDFWRMRCEEDFKYALRCFNAGVPMFMATLGELGWVTYNSHPNRDVAASIVTCVAGITLLLWWSHTERKWTDFLLGGSNAKLYDPGDSVFPNVEIRGARDTEKDLEEVGEEGEEGGGG
ncbi:hypothetical protein TrCOL_g7438 [Triparma columacea]|uniref:Uncharacterized protein n=1 Tax=Triparma columacea TaxID=722753 RepID=A0A9W7GRS0_9STRA|nr:hypothetical protein TrCOL_g7438 [Triparma columacea]